ncbi:ribosome silencing factor [Limosilactobacillus difficilis]|uniref:ribosome silencing factor n=1 Tax=Limosilactobacillus difficilis TaxID=2991838 RepID=UPI0024B95B91|nr:ribosome silencing factor [Limosilactobacillus difficilis]
MDNSKDLLEMVIKAADGRRAEDIVALKVDQISPMADYFVIMTGGSNRQVQAIANAVVEAAHENGVEIGSVEGKNNAQWVLIDLGDVVVHVFREETRQFYNLEKLWAETPEVDVSQWVKD